MMPALGLEAWLQALFGMKRLQYRTRRAGLQAAAVPESAEETLDHRRLRNLLISAKEDD